EVRAAFGSLEPGVQTGERRRVAGRLGARRVSGGAAFLDLLDRSGRIQLMARVDGLGREPYERLLTLDLGDLLGADGVVATTRTGELSILTQQSPCLASALRPRPASP